jgi:hypothetical protein
MSSGVLAILLFFAWGTFAIVLAGILKHRIRTARAR